MVTVCVVIDRVSAGGLAQNITVSLANVDLGSAG